MGLRVTPPPPPRRAIFFPPCLRVAPLEWPSPDLLSFLQTDCMSQYVAERLTFLVTAHMAPSNPNPFLLRVLLQSLHLMPEARHARKVPHQPPCPQSSPHDISGPDAPLIPNIMPHCQCACAMSKPLGPSTNLVPCPPAHLCCFQGNSTSLYR